MATGRKPTIGSLMWLPRPLFSACLCATVLWPLAMRAAGPLEDDHGNSPAAATLLSPGAATNTTIETDLDEDWFRFVSLPGVPYRIDVTSSSIRDTVLEVRGPDAVSVLAVTNSCRSSAPSRAEVTVSGTPAGSTYYIGVSGYLRFTTGTCAVAVQPLALPVPGPPRNLRVRF